MNLKKSRLTFFNDQIHGIIGFMQTENILMKKKRPNTRLNVATCKRATNKTNIEIVDKIMGKTI